MTDQDFNDAVSDLADQLEELSDTNQRVRRTAVNNWAAANNLIDQSEDFLDEYRNAGVNGFREVEQFVEGENYSQQGLENFMGEMESHDSGRRDFLGVAYGALAALGMGALTDLSGAVGGDKGYDLDWFGVREQNSRQQASSNKSSSGTQSSSTGGTSTSETAASSTSQGTVNYTVPAESLGKTIDLMDEYVSEQDAGIPMTDGTWDAVTDGDGAEVSGIESTYKPRGTEDDSILSIEVSENGEVKKEYSGTVHDSLSGGILAYNQNQDMFESPNDFYEEVVENPDTTYKEVLE